MENYHEVDYEVDLKYVLFFHFPFSIFHFHFHFHRKIKRILRSPPHSLIMIRTCHQFKSIKKFTFGTNKIRFIFPWKWKWKMKNGKIKRILRSPPHSLIMIRTCHQFKSIKFFAFGKKNSPVKWVLGTEKTNVAWYNYILSRNSYAYYDKIEKNV